MSKGNHHPNTRGLIPFKKGQSGNPKGRPKGTVSITDAIRAKLLSLYPEKDPKLFKEKKRYVDKIIDAILSNALDLKDVKTLNQIWAYMDGQPKAIMDIDVDKESLNELTNFFRLMAKNKK